MSRTWGFDSLGFVYYYYYYYYYYFGVVLFHFDFHWFNSYFYKVFSFLANTPHFCFKKVLDKHSCMKETVLKPVGSSRQSISRTVNKWFILRASVLLSWAGKSQDVWPTEYILKGQQPHKSGLLFPHLFPGLVEAVWGHFSKWPLQASEGWPYTKPLKTILGIKLRSEEQLENWKVSQTDNVR